MASIRNAYRNGCIPTTRVQFADAIVSFLPHLPQHHRGNRTDDLLKVQSSYIYISFNSEDNPAPKLCVFNFYFNVIYICFILILSKLLGILV